MPSVFEHSWPLLLAALVVFLIVGTWRAVVPEKNRWWQWCFPLAVALFAVGLDGWVATDHEQIVSLSRRILKTVAAEDTDGLRPLLAADYRDSVHQDREALLVRARSSLSHSPILKITKLSQEIESLQAPQASVKMETVVVFEKKSRLASLYKQQFFVTLRLHMVKHSRREWLIQRIEPLAIDRTSMGWGQISGW